MVVLKLELQFEDVSGLLQSVEQLAYVANRPCFGYYSQLFTVVYRCLPVPTVFLVRTQLPASSGLSACYCPAEVQTVPPPYRVPAQI